MKKLTDEEMLNRLELYARDGIWWDGIVEMYDILDLIHRLQEDYSKLKERYVKVLNLNEKVIAEQEAKIERLTEENKKLTEENRVVNHNLDFHRNEKFKLQKQVNELKAENTELYKEHTTLIAGSILKQQDIVKDTAKEILVPLIDCEKQIDPLKTGIRWSVLKGFCKKFGVEVE